MPATLGGGYNSLCISNFKQMVSESLIFFKYLHKGIVNVYSLLQGKYLMTMNKDIY